VVVDKSGNLYVANTDSNYIYPGSTVTVHASRTGKMQQTLIQSSDPL
jgi:hypothetical protein